LPIKKFFVLIEAKLKAEYNSDQWNDYLFRSLSIFNLSFFFEKCRQCGNILKGQKCYYIVKSTSKSYLKIDKSSPYSYTGWSSFTGLILKK